MRDRIWWLLLPLQFLWLFLAGAAVLGFRTALLPWRPALVLVAVAVGGVLSTGFFSLLLLFLRLRAGRRDGGSPCLLATALSLPFLIGVLLLGVRGKNAPPINDISTDTDNPPVFRAAKQLRRADDNSVDYPGKTAADQQRQAYPDIVPLIVPMTPAEAFAHSCAIAEKLGWRITGQAPGEGLIEAVDRSLFFGFADDIVIRITAAGTGSRIDLRSASRSGIGDLGVNARRIVEFRQAFDNIQHK